MAEGGCNGGNRGQVLNLFVYCVVGGAGGREWASAYAHTLQQNRYERKYKSLRMSHGIVTHAKEEWSLVKRVTIFDSTGRSSEIWIKCGTPVADGAWAELKASFPSQVKSHDHERLAEYVLSWAWRARRHGSDIFKELGASMSSAH